MISQKIYFILLLVFITACSKSEEFKVPEEFAEYENLSVFSPKSEPEFNITLNRQTVFGETEDVLLGSWLSAAVDDRGRVFVADHQETVLHLYNPDGTYNRQIGQEGEGPGEYRNVSVIKIDSDYLHLMDRNLNRITRYDINTFEVAGNVAIAMDEFMFPSTFFLQTDSTYLIQTGVAYSPRQDEDEIERTIDGRIMNSITGELADSTVFSFPTSETLVHRENGSVSIMNGLPYLRSSILRVQNGKLIYGWGDDFLFKIYNHDGGYERAIYHPYQNPPLPRDDILAQYSEADKQWQNMVQSADMPETLPIFDNFLVDDEDRIWVRKMTENLDESEYVVLANSGELLAKFNWPADNVIQQIKKGYLYALVTEEETGLREIVKYEVNFEKI